MAVGLILVFGGGDQPRRFYSTLMANDSKPNKEMDILSDARVSGLKVGYMELRGAVKDADCKKVKVEGGISKQLGCCNIFEPQSRTTKLFNCGNCEYVKGKSDGKQK